jgi:shikimate 5-dehydrogenase
MSTDKYSDTEVLMFGKSGMPKAIILVIKDTARAEIVILKERS